MKKINFINVLYFVIFIELINIFYFSFYFIKNDYLPSPFIWDKSNTYMDFYNPLFWVIKDGFYTSFNSIYPALNYFYLKIFAFGVDAALIENPFQLRDASLVLSLLIISINLAIVAVVVNMGEWHKLKCAKIIVFLAFALSSPVLFALERGNLIFLALFFMALYLNSSNPWMRPIFFGLMVNVKPYFILLILLDVNIHSFNRSALTRNIFSAMLIFISLGCLAEIDFIKFISLYFGFSSGSVISWDGYVALPNTLSSLVFIKKNFIDLTGGGGYGFWVSLLRVLAILGPAITFATCLLRPVKTNELVIGALILLGNFSPSTGGYIYLIYILLIPYLIESDEYKNLNYLVLLIFCLPFDWYRVIELIFPLPFQSYLGGGAILGEITVWVSLSSVLRPILNFSLMSIFTFKLIRKYGFFKSNAMTV